MAEVLKPKQFNERFTLALNAEGKPIERSLCEMTAGEVLAAVEWHLIESDRLERETRPFAEMAKVIKTDLPDDSPPEKLRCAIEKLRCALEALRQAVEANQKAARLVETVRANIPQWRLHDAMSFGKAIRRFWPGGRAS